MKPMKANSDYASAGSRFSARICIPFACSNGSSLHFQATQLLPIIYLDEGEFPGRRSRAGETALRFALVQTTLEEPHVSNSRPWQSLRLSDLPISRN